MDWSRILGLGLFLFAPLLTSGCGDLTAGGLGEVEVYATADEGGSPSGTSADNRAAGPRGSPAAGGRAPASAEHGAAAEGQLIARLQVYLRSEEDGQWLELTDGIRDLTLDLSGGAERRVAVRFVSTGRYSRLRVVFHDVEAFVTGGLIVGGLPFTGTVTVDFGAEGTLDVEREVLLEIERDDAVDLLLNLNADAWLPTLSLVTRTVAAVELESALGVRVR
jgi:hypothetical protein